MNAARTSVPESRDDAERATGDVATSIVLPAYEEAGNLGPLCSEILEVVASDEMADFRPVEIIVVDDGSTDDTGAVIRELADKHDAVRGIFLQRNFGQSAALQAGFDRARGEYVVTLDADGQNNPADIPTLLETLTDGYDCVSGWRTERRDPVSKRVPSKIQTVLATFTGPEIHDFGCTLKAYRRTAVSSIQLHGEGHRYIPAKLYDRGFRITEVPVDHRPREHGSTKYGPARLLRGFVDLGFNVFWNRYGTRPFHLLGGIGVILLLIGGTLGVHAVISKYVFGASLFPHLPRLILIVGLVVFGFQMVMFGLIAEMVSRLLYRDEAPYRIAAVYDGQGEEQEGDTGAETDAEIG